jgi:cytoskeletal protein RodZ
MANEDSGLTKGGIAGLIIGIIAGVIVGGLAVWLLMRRRESRRIAADEKKRSDIEDQSSASPNEEHARSTEQEQQLNARSPAELANDETSRMELPADKEGKHLETRRISELQTDGNAHEIEGIQQAAELDGTSIPGPSKEMGQEVKSESEVSISEEELVPRPLEIKKPTTDDATLGIGSPS